MSNSRGGLVLRQLTVALPAEDFRRKVLRHATERVCLVRVLHVEFAQAEVTQGDVTCVIKQNVLGLQVTDAQHTMSVPHSVCQ